MKSEGRNHMAIYTMAIVGLFLAGFFMLVVFGSQAYRGTVNTQDDNRESRAVLAYISTSIKDNDTEGAVKLMDSQDGKILVISDGDTGYALRIYAMDGKVVEDFGKEDGPLDPDNAQVIGETGTFSLDMPEKDVLKVETDEGGLFVKLRSEEGGRS